MKNKLYDLELRFNNGNKVNLTGILEYCFAKKHLFILKENGDSLAFVKNDINEAYRKLPHMKIFKKIFIPRKN